MAARNTDITCGCTNSYQGPQRFLKHLRRNTNPRCGPDREAVTFHGFLKQPCGAWTMIAGSKRHIDICNRRICILRREPVGDFPTENDVGELEKNARQARLLADEAMTRRAVALEAREEEAGYALARTATAERDEAVREVREMHQAREDARVHIAAQGAKLRELTDAIFLPMITFGSSCVHEVLFRESRDEVYRNILDTLDGTLVYSNNRDIFGRGSNNEEKENVEFIRRLFLKHHSDRGDETADPRTAAVCGALFNAARKKNATRLVSENGCLVVVHKTDAYRTCSFKAHLPVDVIKDMGRLVRGMQTSLDEIKRLG